ARSACAIGSSGSGGYTMRAPRGSFSSRTPSPNWNRTGGVLRSTSITAPGRGIRPSMVAGGTPPPPHPRGPRSQHNPGKRPRSAAEQELTVYAVESARARAESDALIDVGRIDHLVGAHLLGQLALGRMLGDRDQAFRRGEQPDRGHCQQPDRAGAEHDDNVVF